MLLSVAILGLAVVGLSGCTRSTSGKPEVAGILFQEDQFFRMVELGMRDAAEKQGVEPLVGNSGNSLDKEVQLVDTYIVRGVGAIVISPLNSKTSATALKRAHAKGIKIITYNTALEADFPVSFIESDQKELGASTGRAARKYIEEKLGAKAKIAVLAFDALNPEQSKARVQGFLDEVKKLPGVEIVGTQDAWLAAKAADVASALLTSQPDLNIIWAANEGGTVGAVTAVKNAGKAGKVVVFGTDMSVQLADFLLADDNVLQAVTGQKPFEIGTKAMETAVQAIHDKPVEKNISLPGVLFSRAQPDEVQKYRQRLEELRQ